MEVCWQGRQVWKRLSIAPSVIYKWRVSVSPQEHTPLFRLWDCATPFQIWFAQVRAPPMWCELEGLFAAADRMLISKRGLFLLAQVSEAAFANWHKSIADDITRVMSPVWTVCHVPQSCVMGTGWSLLTTSPCATAVTLWPRKGNSHLTNPIPTCWQQVWSRGRSLEKSVRMTVRKDNR